ncbi:MAG TPA: hypothetical protein VHW09_10335 [Bryobacteraceae bacterium]|jgi:hypothetical protein|nr:hypothetical protein [Bryobacteraceae bacterium]
MSTKPVIVENSHPPAASPAIPRSTEYGDLVRRICRTRSVLAVVGAGAGSRSKDAVRGIAGALAGAGHRVVIVDVNALLENGPLAARDFAAGPFPNIKLWPPSDPGENLFQPVRLPGAHSEWLPSLRREFDVVILDCPPLQSDPAAVDIAAMADAAVLVVESGVTSKRQIKLDQRHMELQGVKLAGCILMDRR